MSSLILFRYADRVVLLSDGSAYKLDGTLIGATPKVFPLPHLNCVVSVRGSGAIMALVAAWLTAEVDVYDDIEAGLPDFMKQITPAEITDPVNAFDVYVAGFSESRGADSFIMANHTFHPDVPQYVATRTGPIMAAPGDAAFHRKLATIMPPGASSVDDFEAEPFGLQVMEMQRSERFEMQFGALGDLMHVVGSFCQMTTIHRDRIETRILRRWNDKRGALINPEVAA